MVRSGGQVWWSCLVCHQSLSLSPNTGSGLPLSSLDCDKLHKDTEPGVCVSDGMFCGRFVVVVVVVVFFFYIRWRKEPGFISSLRISTLPIHSSAFFPKISPYFFFFF